MRTATTLLSLFAGACLGGSVQAGEVEQMAGVSVKLGEFVGTAYYTVQKDGYALVATMASGQEAMPVRFGVTLLSGQKVYLSVPRLPGQDPIELAIERIADRVFVNDGEKVSSPVNRSAIARGEPDARSARRGRHGDRPGPIVADEQTLVVEHDDVGTALQDKRRH